MTQNLLPEIFDRPFRSFPSPLPNLFMSPCQNLTDTISLYISIKA